MPTSNDIVDDMVPHDICSPVKRCWVARALAPSTRVTSAFSRGFLPSCDGSKAVGADTCGLLDASGAVGR